jgi:aspartyl-tRNA(Asn)/glutamyl-tRNA(Gln) amidotransferase subunit B
MEEGSLRCDANISVRPVGEQKLGIKTELKNLNSFRFLKNALEYEIARQIQILDQGGTIVQETRLWNTAEHRTVSMRSKEEAHDYRYFPEPDLPPLVIDAAWKNEIRASMPELPEARRNRFIEHYGLPAYDASVLTTSRALAGFFERTASLCENPKAASNWIMGDLLRDLKEFNQTIEDSPVQPDALAALVRLVDAGEISGKMAKDVFETMFREGKSPQEVIAEKGLKQITDPGKIEGVIREIIASNPKIYEQYRGGKKATFGFFVGQVMKATKGQANPQLVNDLLKKVLDS